jgi:hypothetical protein
MLRKRSTEIKSGEIESSKRWSATLVTPSELAGAVQLRGSAWWAPMAGVETTRATINISNATPGGVHPWHIHKGRCGADGGIVGPAEAYKALKIDNDGKATASVTLNMPLPTEGEYYVNVHASPSNMGTIVACGNLAPPVQ